MDPFRVIAFFLLLMATGTPSDAFLNRLFRKRTGHQERPGFYYNVKPGDSFYSLSRRYHVPVNDLKRINRIRGNILPIKRIYIPRSTYVIQPNQKYEQHPHPKGIIHTRNAPPRTEDHSVPNKVKGNKQKPTTESITQNPKTKFFWPVQQPRLLEHGSFGAINGKARNAGILLSSDEAEVRPSRKGKLVFQGNLDGYGKTVILDHLDDYFTIYAHLSNFKRYKEGQWISRQKLIGYTGKIGSTGEGALHFEVRHLNQALDPLLFLDRNELKKSETN